MDVHTALLLASLVLLALAYGAPRALHHFGASRAAGPPPGRGPPAPPNAAA